MPVAGGRLTTVEAAEVLGVERSTLSRWVQLGKLQAEKLPGRTGAMLFDPDEVARLGRELAAEAEARAAEAAAS